MNEYLIVGGALLTFLVALVLYGLKRKSFIAVFFAAWLLFGGIRAVNRAVQDPEPDSKPAAVEQK